MTYWIKASLKNFKKILKSLKIIKKKILKKMECRKIIGPVPANALFAITLFISGLTIFTTLIVTVYEKIISSQFLEYSFL